MVLNVGIDYYPDLLTHSTQVLIDHSDYLKQLVCSQLDNFTQLSIEEQNILIQQIQNEFIDILTDLKMINNLQINSGTSNLYFSEEQ